MTVSKAQREADRLELIRDIGGDMVTPTELIERLKWRKTHPAQCRNAGLTPDKGLYLFICWAGHAWRSSRVFPWNCRFIKENGFECDSFWHYRIRKGVITDEYRVGTVGDEYRVFTKVNGRNVAMPWRKNV